VSSAAGDADVVLLVTDVYGDALTNNKIMNRLIHSDRPVVVAVNKLDLFSRFNVSANSNTSQIPVADFHPSSSRYDGSTGTSTAINHTSTRRTTRLGLKSLLGVPMSDSQLIELATVETGTQNIIYNV